MTQKTEEFRLEDVMVNRNKRGFSCIGLHNPKFIENVGSALRACGVYNSAFMAVSGKRYRHTQTDTMKAFKHLPLFTEVDLKSMIPMGVKVVAVDIIDGAIPLPEYNHPESAFYIFGAEDETLDESIIDWCDDVVYIPTNGCMNLAATINVVLYDRLAKQIIKD